MKGRNRCPFWDAIPTAAYSGWEKPRESSVVTENFRLRFKKKQPTQKQHSSAMKLRAMSAFNVKFVSINLAIRNT